MQELEPQEVLRAGSALSERGPAPAPCWIDVRSPGEYEKGRIPFSLNLPILDNEERAVVGTAYKQEGQAAAIETGHRLVGPHRQARIDAWCGAIQKARPRPAVLFCWRGGLRSQTAARWISDAGMDVPVVRGGYKALRQVLLQTFQAPLRPLVVAGMTGSGKTDLLSSVSVPKIDLEDLAAHRGSSFGANFHRPQPAQATFENTLGLRLLEVSPREFLVEDESVMIGRIEVPTPVKEALSRAPIVLLEVDADVRIRNIAHDYVWDPLTRLGVGPERLEEHLVSSVLRLQKKLGGLRTQEIISRVRDACRTGASSLDEAMERHRVWISTLLNDYYDPYYRRGLERGDRPIAFRGNFKECQEWISQRFDSPRP